jgi:lipid II:glycine glycyltransferase (peptidoglycan interpeptide bridge formation enzyme)
MSTPAVPIIEVPLSELPKSSSFLQSSFWGTFKSGFGQAARSFILGENTPLLVMLRPLPKGFTLAYIPHGPGGMERFPRDLYPEGPTDFLITLGEELKRFLPEGTLFIRFEPPWEEYTEVRSPLKKPEFDVHPPSTVVLDISPPEEKILMGMKSKTRYNVRLAAKKGVTVERGSREDLPRWYSLYEETAKRDKITLHAYSYYDGLFRLAEEVDLRLYLAKVEGRILAGIINLHYGDRCTYLYGASSGEKRNHMPAYALQWEGIREAKRAGLNSYDFFGIPSTTDPGHPMHGLYRFKTGFGGIVLNRPGCIDFPLHPGYSFYRIAEKFRTFYYRSLRKRF